MLTNRCLPMCVLVLLSPASWAAAQPLADHHQHLFSPALAAFVGTASLSPGAPPEAMPIITAADLVRHLDDAGIRRAAVLSTAYMFASPTRQVEDEQKKVMTENDWTAAQVAQFPDRLAGLCAVNPLRDYALDEIARCAKVPQLRRGVKVHLANSRVDYRNAEHIARLRALFRAANAHRLAIVVHMRPNDDKISYGREEAAIFLNDVLPAAPDVAVQIAHMAGETGNEQAVGDQALSAFVDAIARNDPRLRQVWFDVTQVATARTGADRAAVIVRRIRQLGPERVVYGSDPPIPNNLPRENWAAFRKLPLTDAEFQIIAANVPPYMR